ncbi:outer membrane beta-barrel protein [bacterium SCSIO 12741]|nr:outer membrane beta-barrel protein [bacterium SCSIO 12741]
MRTLFFLLAALLISPVLKSQTHPGGGDINLDDNRMNFDYSWEEWQDRKNKHWQGLDIGINSLIYEDGTDVPPAGFKGMQLDYGRSFYFGVNIYEQGIPIVGEYFKGVVGIGLDYYNFQLKGNDLMVSEGDSMTLRTDTVFGYRNNNMKNSWVTVPLLLGVNTSQYNSSSFHIAAGVILGYRLTGKQKIKFWDGEICNTIRRKSNMHQNPWRATATVRIGYGNFHLFGNYSLTDYWAEGEAPKARVMVVGIKVIPW